MSLDQLLRRSDFVSPHLSADCRDLPPDRDAPRLAWMRPVGIPRERRARARSSTPRPWSTRSPPRAPCRRRARRARARAARPTDRLLRFENVILSPHADRRHRRVQPRRRRKRNRGRARGGAAGRRPAYLVEPGRGRARTDPRRGGRAPLLPTRSPRSDAMTPCKPVYPVQAEDLAVFLTQARTCATAQPYPGVPALHALRAR